MAQPDGEGSRSRQDPSPRRRRTLNVDYSVTLQGVATEGREVGREGVKVPVWSLPVYGDGS